jgi:hypothetical protein
VYRGTSPQALYQIKSGVPIAKPYSFIDTGYQSLPIGPPDPSFDHANFYYRYEYAGPYIADSVSGNTIGWSDMGAVPGAYVNMVARISDGPGMGQERTILSNTATTVTLQAPWSIQPLLNESTFVICESAWKLVAISSHSPALFDIPYRTGAVIEVTGRSANLQNQESNPALAPVTRLALGANATDVGLPGAPIFSLETPGGGDLTIYEVGFNSAANTDSVTSGTLQLSYWNELNTPSPYTLAQPVGLADTVIYVNLPTNPVTPFIGQLIQIDQELLSISGIDSTGTICTVVRAQLNSAVVAHTAGTQVMQLDTAVIIMPFSSGFFQNRASNNYINTVSLPDIRISAAQLFVTNSFGNSQSTLVCYTANSTQLRTLSGGQFALQINGYLATQTNAAPPLMVEATHAVRDVRMTLRQPPTGYVINVDLLQNGTEYCQLTYDPSQSTPTTVIDGISLPPLMEKAFLTLNISVTLLANYDQALNPGNDLTVTIRF